jgi:hypothetical protein
MYGGGVSGSIAGCECSVEAVFVVDSSEFLGLWTEQKGDVDASQECRVEEVLELVDELFLEDARDGGWLSVAAAAEDSS